MLSQLQLLNIFHLLVRIHAFYVLKWPQRSLFINIDFNFFWLDLIRRLFLLNFIDILKQSISCTSALLHLSSFIDYSSQINDFLNRVSVLHSRITKSISEFKNKGSENWLCHTLEVELVKYCAGHPWHVLMLTRYSDEELESCFDVWVISAFFWLCKDFLDCFARSWW